MTIARRMQFTTIVLTTAVLALGLVLSWNSRNIDKGFEQTATNVKIIEHAFMLRVLADDYVAQKQDSALIQWQNHSGDLINILQQKLTSGTDQRSRVEDIKLEFARASDVFSLLTASETQDAAMRPILRNMLSVHLERIVRQASRIYALEQADTVKEVKFTKYFVIGSMILVLIVIMINQTSTKNLIIQPLRALVQETRRVANGDFSKTLILQSNNEMGLLSRSFSTMTENLRTYYDVLQTEIEQRKQVEKELRSSNKDLEHFAYVASHDLQEPLRTVAGALQMLEMDHKGQLGEDSDRLINYAVDGAKKMRSLVTDLLNYSRIAARNNERTEVDTQSILDQSIHNLRNLIDEKKAGITHDKMPKVVCDSTQLLQVFQNLVGNALKFGPAESPKVHISALLNGGEWVFSVKDNGIGIEEQYCATSAKMGIEMGSF